MTKKEYWSVVLLGLALVMVPLVAQETKKGTTHKVSIKGFEYVPKQLTVHPGDTVVWTNEDIVPHTATAKGVFDSKEIGSKESWTYKAGRKGKFPYICTYHPTMKGELNVE